MAVYLIKELHQRTADVDKDKIALTRFYQVHCNDASDNQITILTNASLPKYGDPFPGYALARVKTTNTQEIAKKTPEGSVWSYTVNYDTTVPDENEGQNPLELPAKYSWTGQQAEKIVEEDINGNGILNSATDPFADPILKKYSLIQLQIVKNVASFDGSLALQYMNRVNSSAFLGGAIGRVYCQNISNSGAEVENEITYYPVTMEFLYNPEESWQPRVLDQGFRYLSGGALKPILSQGKEITAPALLDGGGGQLAVGAAAVFLDFEIYESIDFNSLPIA